MILQVGTFLLAFIAILNTLNKPSKHDVCPSSSADLLGKFQLQVEMAEISRILKPGGVFVATTFLSPIPIIDFGSKDIRKAIKGAISSSTGKSRSWRSCVGLVVLWSILASAETNLSCFRLKEH